MMDAVYLVRPGPNEELRYSLRSVERNTQYRPVVIGQPPSWYSGPLIPNAPRHAGTAATWSHLNEACLSSSVSDPFVLMNDDMFAMRGTGVPAWHRGPMRELHAELRRQYGRTVRSDQYLDGLQRTTQLLWGLGYDGPLSFDHHGPILVHKAEMRKTLHIDRESNIANIHRRSIYGALAELEADRHEDVLIHLPRQVADPSWPWLATTDQSFVSHPVGAIIRYLFPTPSELEK